MINFAVAYRVMPKHLVVESARKMCIKTKEYPAVGLRQDARSCCKSPDMLICCLAIWLYEWHRNRIASHTAGACLTSQSLVEDTREV